MGDGANSASASPTNPARRCVPRRVRGPARSRRPGRRHIEAGTIAAIGGRDVRRSSTARVATSCPASSTFTPTTSSVTSNRGPASSRRPSGPCWRTTRSWPAPASRPRSTPSRSAAGSRMACVRSSRSATIAALDQARGERLLRVDHRLHLRCELSDAALPALLDRPRRRVRAEIVSLMNHTPGQRQWRDLDKFRVALRAALRPVGRGADRVDCRAPGERGDGAAGQSRAAIASGACGRARVSPVTTIRRRSDVDEAAAAGCVLSEFPTTAPRRRTRAARGLAVVAGAPNLVRGASHSGNVSAAELARARPSPRAFVRLQPVESAARRLSPPRSRRLAASDRRRGPSRSHPRASIGLDDRGEIAAGCRADVIVVSHTALGPVHPRDLGRRPPRLLEQRSLRDKVTGHN